MLATLLDSGELIRTKITTRNVTTHETAHDLSFLTCTLQHEPFSKRKSYLPLPVFWEAVVFTGDVVANSLVSISGCCSALLVFGGLL